MAVEASGDRLQESIPGDPDGDVAVVIQEKHVALGSREPQNGVAIDALPQLTEDPHQLIAILRVHGRGTQHAISVRPGDARP